MELLLGSGTPRSVIAVSRLTMPTSAAENRLAVGPIAVAGSRSNLAVRPVKWTSPPTAMVMSAGGIGDGASGGVLCA